MTPESHQPGIISPDTTLVILTWISFFALLFILQKFAWKPILAGLRQREEYIRKSLDDADKIKAQIAEMEATKIKILNEAKDTANTIIEQARKTGHELAGNIETQAKKSAEEIISSARLEIEGEREHVRQGLIKESARTAIMLAEKILKENLDNEKNKNLINQAMKEIV